MIARESIHVGSSGWHYRHWIGTFYPRDLKPEYWLEFYSRNLNSVEINNSFYRLPLESTFTRWGEIVPEDFVFAVKASRYITHIRKLRDVGESVERFMARADALQGKLGVVLFQLPPAMKSDSILLGSFLSGLPEGYRFAMEFRHESWFNDRTYSLLEDNGAAFCIHDAGGCVTPKAVTGGCVYVRLHGATGMYRGCYGDEQLRGWSDRIMEWRGRGLEVFFYFNNDWDGFAVHNAVRLREMMSEH